MAHLRKPLVPVKPPVTDTNDEIISDIDAQVFECRLYRNSTPYKLRQAAFGRFWNGNPRIPTWQIGLAKYIIPATYHFPKFVLLCAQNYSPDTRTDLSTDHFVPIFDLKPETIASMLALEVNPGSQELKDDVLS